MSGREADRRGRLRVVGPGRAGGSLATALGRVGWQVLDPVRHGDDPTGAAHDVDLVVIATPDRAVVDVAAAIDPDPDALVVHLAGSLGTDVLGAHSRRGALHPLVSLPDPEVGSTRLAGGAWFALAANEPADRSRLKALVAALGGRSVVVADADRAAYHAAAVVAANHLTALVGQVERIAAPTGVPLAAFMALATQTLDGIAVRGPAASLTGPVARGDWATVAAHLRALDPVERPGYAAMAECAARLCGDAPVPAWLARARQDGTAPDESDPR